MLAAIEVAVAADGLTLAPRVQPGRPIALGRGSSCDVVLTDPFVDWVHALVWTDGVRLWVQDLGSSNGTFVGEERLTEITSLGTDGELRLGPNVDLRLRLRADAQPPALALEATELGVRYPLRGDSFVLGDTPEADVRLVDSEVAVLRIGAQGGLRLLRGGAYEELDVGGVFSAGGQKFRVVRQEETQTPTLRSGGNSAPIELRCSLDGPTGPMAEVTDLTTGQCHRVRSENRVVLLYLLGRRLVADRDCGVPFAERGWLSDADVTAGIWGRSARYQDGNTLHVLLHRLRSELRKGGVDPTFLVKERRHLRANVQLVRLLDRAR